MAPIGEYGYMHNLHWPRKREGFHVYSQRLVSQILKSANFKSAKGARPRLSPPVLVAIAQVQEAL